MTWTSIPTKVTGDPYTVSMWNLIDKGNQDHLFDTLIGNGATDDVPPAVRATRSSTLAVSGGDNSLAWNDEDYDTDGMHDTGTNPERITIQTAGKYLLIAFVEVTPNSAAPILQIRDSSGNVLSGQRVNGSSGGNMFIEVSLPVACSVSDWFDVNLNLGGAETVQTNSFFSAHFMRD